MLVPLVAVMLGIKANTKTFIAGAFCGVATLSIWHWLLKDPGGVDGLGVGVLANLVTFWAMHRIDRISCAMESRS